jgi:hypothetical protein
MTSPDLPRIHNTPFTFQALSQRGVMGDIGKARPVISSFWFARTVSVE